MRGLLATLLLLVLSGATEETDPAQTANELGKLREQVAELGKLVNSQNEEIESMKVKMEYLTHAAPNFGSLGLIEADETLGEVSTMTHPDRFTHFGTIALRIPRRDRKNVPKKRLPAFNFKTRRNAVHVLVAVNTDRTIKVFDLHQNLLTSLTVDTETRITALTVKSANDRGYLLLGFADGLVEVYAISAWREVDTTTKILSVQGHLERLYSIDPWFPEEAQKAAEEESQVVKAPAVSAIGMYTRKNSKLFTIGYGNGFMRTYRKTGKFRSMFDSTNATIHGIAYDGERTSFPFWTEDGFRFVKSTKMKGVGSHCPLVHGQVTGIAFDAVSGKKASLMYVTTAEGYLMVHETKKLHRRFLCTPVHEVEVAKGIPLDVQAILGYILVSSPTHLYIYNISSVTSTLSPIMLERRDLGSSEEGDETAAARTVLRSAYDAYGYTVVASAQVFDAETCSESDSGSGSTLVVFESYLENKDKEKSKKGWAGMLSRAPIVLVGGILLLVWTFGGKAGGNPLSKLLGGRSRRSRGGKGLGRMSGGLGGGARRGMGARDFNMADIHRQAYMAGLTGDD